ncbi:MAG: short-chain dehydrogenase [Candidatus Rokuibacteriota bacterium]|nr:MAG: short-chain dehydrogenase [Candidatus Rokubacteria bacterium]
MTREGGEAIAVPTDVCDPESVARLIHVTLETFGRLDVLVNNAGVGIRRTVTESTMEEYDIVMEPNVRGVFLCMKYGIPPLVEQGSGSVINMASVASFVGFTRDAAYCASKGAVLMLTRQAALDYARFGVRVNAICPGFIDTPMLRYYCDQQADPDAAWREVLAQHPMGRVGTPADVAGAAVFLAGDDSKWVTGSSIAVDGGLLAQ